MEDVAPAGRAASSVEWERYEDADFMDSDFQGAERPASTEEELKNCQAECLALGFGGFVVRRRAAWLRPYSRQALIDKKSWRSKATLYVAPQPPDIQAESEAGLVIVEYTTEEGLTIPRVALAEVLAANSGYFASVFRHGWSDGESSTTHRLHALPGGDRAFEYVAPWLTTPEGQPIGDPWPVQEVEDVESIVLAAAYLDAVRLLRAAVKSWHLCGPRSKEDLLRVAEAIVEASSQFSGEDSSGVMDELKGLLQEFPKSEVPLSSEFLAMPGAGLTILDTREGAKESIMGHLRNVAASAASIIPGLGKSERRSSEMDDRGKYTPHEFAVRLFEAHSLFFIDNPPALRRLLRYVDPHAEIPVPLCFKIAAAAASVASVSEAEVFAGERLAVDILERNLSCSADPAQAASHGDCVTGLFGAWGHALNGRSGHEDAGEVRCVGPQVLLDLDVLARPLVPPAAAAVVLSRVLSSWGAMSDVRNDGTALPDPAAVILAGVASDRQGLRRLLEAVLPMISQDNSHERGTEWGGSFDYAVPELRAAFMHAASVALTAGTSVADDLTLRLLFRVVYQPSGGLQGIRFPMELLKELRPHNAACHLLVAQRVHAELKAAAHRDLANGFALAAELWDVVQWDEIDMELIVRTVLLFREWLGEAKSKLASDERARAKAMTVRLLLKLPLDGISNPEELFGPPLPSHFFAHFAHRSALRAHESIAALKAENAALKYELARLRDSSRTG